MTVRIEDIRATLRARDSAAAARAKGRAERLRARLPAAKARLVEAGALDVWLFGSLAVGPVSESSDVDLAVSGLAADSYFRVLGDLMALFGGPVDLVRIEEAGESLCERIRLEGRRL